MNDLPLHLLDEILFKLDLKSLAMMRCTNLFIKSHISDDPNFEKGYSFRARSGFIYTCGPLVFYKPSVSSCDSMSQLRCLFPVYPYCYILGSCSGHLLLYRRGLFVVMNPVTKMFRHLDHSGSTLLATIIGSKKVNTERAMCVGFAVDRSRTTKRFKIVCVLENHTKYAFEVNDGDTWRLSETTITTNSKSDLTKRMKPVYLEGTLHWLRNDGSIIAFNPVTEQARFIPSIFHPKPSTKLFFASDDKINRLTLISGTKEAISVYTLVEGTKWALARKIKNVPMTENELEFWNVVAYDGKHLVVKDKGKASIFGVAHVYDMEANSWGALWSTRCKANYNDLDFCKFKPFFSFFEHTTKVASKDLPICRIIRLLDTTDGLGPADAFPCRPGGFNGMPDPFGMGPRPFGPYGPRFGGDFSGPVPGMMFSLG
ncbi:unnamed protein product [Arabis nemorensis]|uniref:F-box domain-containing protein n=1 Tax=Arabis nemorensis TaxID=586526 RepID=A0A565AUK8_9BRAS|nr:unnamed protein product [Arabis nemorensis]